MGDEMNVEYLREMKQNYLMFEVEESQEQGYEARMMIGNSIEGLLKFRIKKMDNQCKFCYEITSKQPLSRLLETTTRLDPPFWESRLFLYTVCLAYTSFILTNNPPPSAS